MKKTYKFVIVGGGNIGDIHAQVISKIDGAELVAIVDPNTENAKQFSDKYSCNYYASCHDVLEKEDFSIVSVCTPSSMHCSIAYDFAVKGKHLIIEKPIDINIEAVDKLLDIALKNNVKICSIFQHRFDNSIIKAKSIIDEGKLGKLFFGACHTKWYRDQNYYDSGKWRGTWKHEGGGALINQSIHYIDLLLYLMGDVDEVYGLCGTYAHKHIEVEDLGIATLKFKNGGLGIIEGTTAAYPGLYSKLHIYGDEGSLGIENDSLVWVKSMNNVSEEELPMDRQNIQVGATEAMNISVDSHIRQYTDMLNAIESGSEPLVNGIEGRKSLEVVTSIYKSWMNNKPVKL